MKKIILFCTLLKSIVVFSQTYYKAVSMYKIQYRDNKVVDSFFVDKVCYDSLGNLMAKFTKENRRLVRVFTGRYLDTLPLTLITSYGKDNKMENFYYDSNNRVIKRVEFFNKKILTICKYTYLQNEQVINCKEYSKNKTSFSKSQTYYSENFKIRDIIFSNNEIQYDVSYYKDKGNCSMKKDNLNGKKYKSCKEVGGNFQSEYLYVDSLLVEKIESQYANNLLIKYQKVNFINNRNLTIYNEYWENGKIKKKTEYDDKGNKHITLFLQNSEVNEEYYYRENELYSKLFYVYVYTPLAQL